MLYVGNNMTRGNHSNMEQVKKKTGKPKIAHTHLIKIVSQDLSAQFYVF